jgi:uncharacterized protein (TIGR02265 family)
VEFVEPDWSAPLDLESYLARIPTSDTIKGMFLSGLVQVAAAAGHKLEGARDRYIPFNDYPLREQAQLLAEAARVLSPDRSLRLGLRRLGRGAIYVWQQTTVGRVAWAAAVDAPHVIEMYAKMYSVVYAGASMTIIDATPGAFILRAERVYSFLDSHHVGVLEGGLRERGIEATVKVRMRTPSDGELLCTY